MPTSGVTPVTAKRVLATLQRLGSPPDLDAALLDRLRQLASQPTEPVTVGCTVHRREDPARTGTVIALRGDRAKVRWHIITSGIKSATRVRVRDLERLD